jgi:DmsE family decaheme c-type cytochrome
VVKKLIAVFGAGLLMLCANILWADTAAEGGTQVCAECHEEHVAASKAKPHSVLDTKKLWLEGHTSSCTSCHGDVKDHLEEGGAETVFSFKETDPVMEKTNRCLACHKTDNARFFASPHGKSAMDCTSCHTVHGKKMHAPLLAQPAKKLCASCHEDVYAQFMLNERHRLQEGILSCASCHDPHEPATRERLGGFKQEACFKCHADKQGPFLYEHGSVRVEGCTSCHEVHGSANRHMLNIQNVAELCYSCHSVVPGWHSRFEPTTNCTVCHSTIHGSNFSDKFIK